MPEPESTASPTPTPRPIPSGDREYLMSVRCAGAHPRFRI
jgi:hypothetical protein